MNSTQTRLYTRLQLTHRNQRAALSVREAHEKAQLFTTHRQDYARLDSPAKRAAMLRQFVQNVLHLKQSQLYKRSLLMITQQRELITLEHATESL